MCDAIITSPSPSIRKYLKHKLKTVRTKISESPTIPIPYIYIEIKNILGLFHPFWYLSTGIWSISSHSVSFNWYWVYFTPFSIFQPVLGLFHPLRNLSTDTWFISSPLVFLNRYWVYFTPTTTHIIIIIGVTVMLGPANNYFSTFWGSGLELDELGSSISSCRDLFGHAD